MTEDPGKYETKAFTLGKQKSRREYFFQLSLIKGQQFNQMDEGDQANLLWHWLDACDDPSGWLVEAYAEKDLWLLQIERLANEIDDAEFARRHTKTIVKYFESLIQEHMDDQAVIRW